jgi:hypothetical protein
VPMIEQTYVAWASHFSSVVAAYALSPLSLPSTHGGVVGLKNSPGRVLDTKSARIYHHIICLVEIALNFSINNTDRILWSLA